MDCVYAGRAWKEDGARCGVEQEENGVDSSEHAARSSRLGWGSRWRGRGCGRRTSDNTDRSDPVTKPAIPPTMDAPKRRSVLRAPHRYSLQRPPARQTHHPRVTPRLLPPAPLPSDINESDPPWNRGRKPPARKCGCHACMGREEVGFERGRTRRHPSS